MAAMGAHTLGNLVLVVWEDQIETAAMDVKRLAELGIAHRGALDVPARTTTPPWAVPARNIRARRLPQHEVAGILLVGCHLDPGASNHVSPAAPRQRPV